MKGDACNDKPCVTLSSVYQHLLAHCFDQLSSAKKKSSDKLTAHYQLSTRQQTHTVSIELLNRVNLAEKAEKRGK